MTDSGVWSRLLPEEGEIDEKTISESDSGATSPAQQVIFRPYCMSPQSAATSTAATTSVRDTLVAVRDAVAATVTTSDTSTGTTSSVPCSSGATNGDVPCSTASNVTRSSGTLNNVTRSSGTTTSATRSAGSMTTVLRSSGTAATVPQAGTSTTPSGAATTRAPPSSGNTSQQQTTAAYSTNSEAKVSDSAAAPATSTTKVPRRWEQWNSAEINAFFEALKLYGKDFEQISKLMTRRKLNKDKDQIRNYYFNSLKLTRSAARIDEKLIADVPRDIRELFILLNGLEWKRRGCGRFDQAKFRQLMMEGSTSVMPPRRRNYRSVTVKVKKKKQLVLVRTPICPALQKFFPSCRLSTPLPTHMFICLAPKTEADRCFVEQCGQNPLIRIKIAIGDQLSRLFSFLKMKWNIRIRKMDEEISKEEAQMKLVLYPDKTTRVGKIVVNLYEATPMIFSLNRLKKEQIQRTGTAKTGTSKQNSEPTKPAKDTNAVAGEGEEVVPDDAEDSSPADEDGPFTLNEHKLLAGLSEDNVHQATVTELFYLCGREAEIRLLYSTGVTRIGDPEPWRIFVSLLDRGYGDTLCKYLGDPQKMAELDNFASEGKTRKRRASASNDAVQPAEPAAKATAVSSENAELESNEIIAAAVVEEENTAFMEQLASLQVCKKKRARSFHRRNPAKGTGIVQVSANPATGHQLMGTPSYQMPRPAFIPQNEQAVASSSNQFVSPAPSDAVISGDAPGGIRFGSGVGGIRFRDGKGKIKSGDRVSAVRFGDGTGGVRVRYDGASGQMRTDERHLTQGSNMVTLTGLNAMEPSSGAGGNSNQYLAANDGNSNMFLSPARENSLLEEYHTSMVEVMQQNSVDYCRNFEEFVANIEGAHSASASSVADGDGDLHLMSQHFNVPVSDSDKTKDNMAGKRSDNGSKKSHQR